MASQDRKGAIVGCVQAANGGPPIFRGHHAIGGGVISGCVTTLMENNEWKTVILAGLVVALLTDRLPKFGKY